MQATRNPEEQATTPLSDTIDIGYLDLKSARFYEAPGGFTGLVYGEKEYKRVSLRRALPSSAPSRFISVADAENKEIGILGDISALLPDQLRIVTRELDKRYFCPTVVSIDSVKDKLGYVYLELTVKGEGATYTKNCAIKDVNKNIRLLDEKRLFLFDVDGNRYIIEDLAALDPKSLKRLEPYLF